MINLNRPHPQLEELSRGGGLINVIAPIELLLSLNEVA